MALQAQTHRSLYRFDVRSAEDYAAGHIGGFRHYAEGSWSRRSTWARPVRGARILLTTIWASAPTDASWLAQMGWETYVLEGGYDRRWKWGRRRLCRSPILRTATGVPMRAPTSLRARCSYLDLGIWPRSNNSGATPPWLLRDLMQEPAAAAAPGTRHRATLRADPLAIAPYDVNFGPRCHQHYITKSTKPQPNSMTAHQRNFPTPIDPVKLDRLAEVAIKIGLPAAAWTGPVADRAHRGAAAGAADRGACLQAGAGLVTPILSDEEVTLARYRFGRDDSFDRAAAGSMSAWQRRS